MYSYLFVGCLNGGGQIKADKSEDSKEVLKRVTDLYKAGECRNPHDSKIAPRLYNDWLSGHNSSKLLYTDYHAVEKMTNALTIKW